MRILGIIIFVIVSTQSMIAQGLQPIGQWREHLPWIQATQVQILGKYIICATPYAVFTYDIENNEIFRKSTINGLSETGITAMAVDDLSGSVIIIYKNRMIDIWRGSQIIPVPDLKISRVSSDFTINSIMITNGYGYISTNAGILVLDIQKHEFKERWLPGILEVEWAATSIAKTENYWYASTNFGLKKISIFEDGSDPYKWESVKNTPWEPNGIIKKVLSVGNIIFIWVGNDIYKGEAEIFKKVYSSDSTILGIDKAENGILVATNGNPAAIKKIKPDGSIEKEFLSDYLKQPRNSLVLDNECWVADGINGLLRIEGNNAEKINPKGPGGFAEGEIKFMNGSMWFAPASVKEAGQPKWNKPGFFNYSDQWQNYNKDQFPEMDTIADIVSIAFQPKTEKLYAASFGGGLVEIDKQNNLRIYKYNSGLKQYPEGSGNFNVSGLATDRFSNLWIANFGGDKQLHLLKPDGQWVSFTIPFSISDNAVSGITIDDEDQKWIISPNSNGLLIWNTGNIPEDPSDDQWKLLTKGIGSGNLPSNNVLCVVKDKNGLIWVGTDKGIGIFNCRNNTFSNTCDAILPVVNNANQTGYLFQDQKVNSIAVDGANRKWIGTSNGLWLISDDGEKVISQFNVGNSSLLSNEIYSLELNPVTGELFIATSNGICSFMGSATENQEQNRKVLVFPNPVPSQYAGTIAVRGLPENSWVKITELNGRLVYQGKSLGGQMIWNGKDGNGKAVSSGVYLVLSADEMNVFTLVTKIIFIK